MEPRSDQDYMRLALEEGRSGLGFVQPNPAVGCVIVNSQGSVIGRGAHLEFGGPHAEVNALNSVLSQDDLKGATVYVTLEPCAHEGKTPSCAKALAKLPISRLVYAIQDPNPQVSGKGVEILRQAGIQVEELEECRVRKECEALAEIFIWNMRHSQPFVALKAGTSQNGSLVPDGDGKWLTGKESLKYVHVLRSQYDAVLVGVDTFLNDDPRLNVRREGLEDRTNYAVVLDPSGRGVHRIESSRLLKCRPPEKIIWATSGKVSAPDGIKVIRLASDERGLDLSGLLDELWRLEIKSLFIEGGAKTYASFLNQSLVNRIYHFSSPEEVSSENMLNWLAYVESELTSKGPVTKMKFGQDDYSTFLI